MCTVEGTSLLRRSRPQLPRQTYAQHCALCAAPTFRLRFRPLRTQPNRTSSFPGCLATRPWAGFCSAQPSQSWHVRSLSLCWWFASARAPYGRLVVTTDFSEPSRHALLCATRLFAGRELMLYHAHSGLATVSPHPSGAIEEAECSASLAATPLPEAVKVRPVLQYGAIESTLTRYVREHDIELVVMGSHGCGGLMSLLLGSTAAKLLDWLPCDMLLVREPIGAT